MSSDSLKKYQYFGPLSGNLSFLLRLLLEKLLGHQYGDALRILHPVLVRSDKLPDLARMVRRMFKIV